MDSDDDEIQEISCNFQSPGLTSTQRPQRTIPNPKKDIWVTSTSEAPRRGDLQVQSSLPQEKIFYETDEISSDVSEEIE